MPSAPEADRKRQTPAAGPTLLQVEGLSCSYMAHASWLPRLGKPPQPVVHDVSFKVLGRETVALVGESGSGKTTIARAIAGLLTPTEGCIIYDEQDITRPVERRPKVLHREIQYVFQNPDASLNPRRRVSHILGRPLELFFGLSGSEKKRRIEQLLNDVHLDASYMRRLPTHLSGGERQRVAIAQALAAEPKLILCDEIVSALDVSVQASILDLLQELQAKRGIAYLFIAHDLAVVRWLAYRTIVLYRGHIMETGTSDEVFTLPFHPYTEILLQSVPEPDPGCRLEPGDDPSPNLDDTDMGSGCPFSARCPYRVEPLCKNQIPSWQKLSLSHSILCHLPAGELAQRQMPTWKHCLGAPVAKL